MISEATLARASAISTATLHEAAGRKGALPGWLRPLDPKLGMTGRAFPVTSLAGDNLRVHHALAECQAGDVLVVDCGRDGKDYGYWGEVMTIAAVTRKVAGLVITGGVRDSARIIELGFPVFAGAICIRGTIKNPMSAGSLGGSIRIGDAIIHHGDLVRGDADGVLVIDPPSVDRVIDDAQRRDADEHLYFERIRKGETTMHIYGLPPASR
jgi:4-hydroxy-4-methyl-2-oxoglutarate aldolase